MNDHQSYFKGKNITVMGLGLLGRGVGDAAYLAACGAEVLVTDLKTEAELADSVAKLREYANITFVLGEHRMEDFEGKDMVLVAAGVPIDSPYIGHAKKSGVRIAQSAALFAELSGIPIIGVTGTRGKSTVTHMIHHVLEVTTGEKVILGGNVRGVSNLQLLKEVTEDSLAVFELDSWQLQGFGWAEISPQIGVFTNFMSDHLNYYKGDEDAYFADKANIFLYQEPSGTLVTIPELLPRIEAYASTKGVTLEQEIILVDSSILPEDCLLATPGEHNRLNAALAYKALLAAGLTDDEIFEGLASFPGVPGRLEYVGEVNEVKMYNDNNATTPAATIAALRALGTPATQNIILIMGGADKGIALDDLLAEIPKFCKQVVLLPGTGTDRVKEHRIGTEVASMKEAVNKALEFAQKGDVIVLSPAFASFGLFKNEYERNDMFMDLVHELIAKNI